MPKMKCPQVISRDLFFRSDVEPQRWGQKGLSTFSKGIQPNIETFEFQREKKQACSIFHAEFKSSAKKILVLWEDGQNNKKHLKIDLFNENKAVYSNWKVFFLINSYKKSKVEKKIIKQD